MGIGHLMRCIALSEEFLTRGYEVVYAADAQSVPWAAAQLQRRGIVAVSPPSTVVEHEDLLREHEPDVVVIDSYVLGPEVYAAVRAAGYPALAIVDGDIAGREADVYLDQNIGAEDDDWGRPEGSLRLAGLRYALMRDDILGHRPEHAPARHRVGPPEVFAFFGGTDAFGVAPRVATALAATGRPFRASVVCATPEAAEAVRRVELAQGQLIEPIEPTNRLAELVVGADLVLSAAGTSSWELLCLGAATALLCVAENQEASYRRVVDLGCAGGLGTAVELAQDLTSAADVIDRLLTDGSLRGELARCGWSLVDGRGRIRVVDELLSHCRARSGPDGKMGRPKPVR
jgi:spore coat polysaccharide biosynthesis predicted glycosyltransferase SpsG